MVYSDGRCYCKKGVGSVDSRPSCDDVSGSCISGMTSKAGSGPDPTPAPTTDSGKEPNCWLACDHYQNGCDNCQQDQGTDENDWRDCCKQSRGYASWTFVYNGQGKGQCYL